MYRKECGLNDETFVFKQKSSNFPVILVLNAILVYCFVPCVLLTFALSCVCLLYPRKLVVTLPPLLICFCVARRPFGIWSDLNSIPN